MKYFKKYGVFYEVKGDLVKGKIIWTLYGAPAHDIRNAYQIVQNPTGSKPHMAPDMDGYAEVTAPHDAGQVFLDDINKYFLTNFQMEQFAGR